MYTCPFELRSTIVRMLYVIYIYIYQSRTLNETKRCDTENAKRNETVLSGHEKKTKRNGKLPTRDSAKRNETEMV